MKILVICFALILLLFIPKGAWAVGGVCAGINCDPGYCCNSHLAGTKVKTAIPFALGGYGDVLIENLKVGDRVLGYDVISEEYVENVVTVFRVSIRPDGIYTMKAGDHSLSATANHPIYVGPNKFDDKVDALGYKNAEDLTGKENFFVLAKDKIKDVPLSNVYKIPGDHQVYTLSVSGTNNYFANEILVHNKSCWTNCSVSCDPGWYECNSASGCCQIGCVPNWSTCSQSCGGGSQNDGCGNYRSCNNGSCCTPVAPEAPVTTAPTDGQVFTTNPTVNFAWNAISSWGEGCNNALSYHLCVSDTNGGACNRYDLGGIAATATNDSSFVPTREGVHWWRIAAVNNGQETWSTWKSFSVKVVPNCTGLTGPTEIRVGASSNFSANFSTPMVDSDLGAQIFYVLPNTTYAGLSMQSVITNPQNVTGTWVPAVSDAGPQTLHCRAWNDGIAECRPPTLVDAWPRAACAGPDYSFNTCVEGGPYYGAWGSCDPSTHKRTKACTEDCGTNDCAAAVVTEDCLGEIRGTLFDASELTTCPGFDPATGYLTGLGTGLGTASRSFGLTGTWPIISGAVTNSNGNYNASTYAPGSYTYDFDVLRDIYWTDAGPKLTCTSPTAVVPGNPAACTTQPCSLVNNMSFGFWRVFGGWWQVEGGNVYAEQGIKSPIPPNATGEQSLILPDSSPANRVGLLAYGVPKPADMLGTNPNAKVSTPLWEKQSKYEGPIYDWGFFNTRFKNFPVTDWTEGQAINYDDGGNGYQIFRTTSGVASFDFSPTGTQKVIFLVTGDVHVTSDITVPSGAFLAVIASGNVYFDYNVGSADGWYIGSRIRVPCKDTDGTAGCDKDDIQFLGNGTFVGWSGVDLGRNSELTNNNNIASEKFTYRRDLYLSAPESMKVYSKLYKPFVP